MPASETLSLRAVRIIHAVACYEPVPEAANGVRRCAFCHAVAFGGPDIVPHRSGCEVLEAQDIRRLVRMYIDADAAARSSGLLLVVPTKAPK